jgi:uncharacterized membrane protein YciS (DUF1049 family)
LGSIGLVRDGFKSANPLTVQVESSIFSSFLFMAHILLLFVFWPVVAPFFFKKRKKIKKIKEEEEKIKWIRQHLSPIAQVRIC